MQVHKLCVSHTSIGCHDRNWNIDNSFSHSRANKRHQRPSQKPPRSMTCVTWFTSAHCQQCCIVFSDWSPDWKLLGLNWSHILTVDTQLVKFSWSSKTLESYVGVQTKGLKKHRMRGTTTTTCVLNCRCVLNCKNYITQHYDIMMNAFLLLLQSVSLAGCGIHDGFIGANLHLSNLYKIITIRYFLIFISFQDTPRNEKKKSQKGWKAKENIE